jgi:hypothetical protein
VWQIGYIAKVDVFTDEVLVMGFADVFLNLLLDLTIPGHYFEYRRPTPNKNIAST